MNQRVLSGLRETVYAGSLPNGLTIRVAPKKGFQKKYAFFAANYGSVDTSFYLDGSLVRTPDGVAHYLEHKMFDIPQGNALQRLSAAGASPNAFTSYHMTAYYFSCVTNFMENLRLLLTFVSQGYFTEESVEKERGIIAQEIKMYEDSPGSRLDENLFRAMYKNHPVRVPVAGTVESIGEITPRILSDCHRGFYDPSNMTLCVVGDVDPEEVEQAAREILPGVPGGVSRRDYGEKEPAFPTAHEIRQRMEVSMPMFTIGFKGPELDPGPQRLKREILGDLAAEVLCGESSRLYQRLYREGVIDSGFGVGSSSIRELNILTMSGDSLYPDRVLDEILEEARRIGREGVDEDLLARLKRSAVGRRIRGLDSFEGLCCRLSMSEFDGYDYYTFPEIYEALTAEDVRALIEREIVPEQAVLSVIEPLHKEA